MAEPAELKGLGRDEKVAVMTYAGDLFSWYAGSVEADTYFCPERHGTYFGSFYLKDARAMGNPGYSIDTSLTGDMGRRLPRRLDASQAARVSGLVDVQRAALLEIVEVRRQISTGSCDAFASTAARPTRPRCCPSWPSATASSTARSCTPTRPPSRPWGGA